MCSRSCLSLRTYAVSAVQVALNLVASIRPCQKADASAEQAMPVAGGLPGHAHPACAEGRSTRTSIKTVPKAAGSLLLAVRSSAAFSRPMALSFPKRTASVVS